MEAKPLISPKEADFLLKLLGGINTPCNILEIGSYSCDGSTPIFTQHIRKHGGSLHMADLFLDECFESRCRETTKGIDAYIFKGYSAELASGCTCSYQFAFIDGDHGYPRILANGHQSGVACDVIAWHPHIAVGGFVVFHDYTGDFENYGEAKYLPIEYAVDSLCFSPFYEFAGRSEKVIAFKKCRDGVLVHTHKPKKAPTSYRDAWRLLDSISSHACPVTVFGTPSAIQRVVQTFMTAFPVAPRLLNCLFNGTDFPKNSIDSIPLIRLDELFKMSRIVILAGTVQEELEMLALLQTSHPNTRPITFMEWFGWFFLGRYGYL